MQSERWSERWSRPGWETHYTHLGARPRSGMPVEELEVLHRMLEKVHLHRLTTQAFVAVSSPENSPTPEVNFFTAVVLKLLQRGRAPLTSTPWISTRVEQWASELSLSRFSERDWLDAVVGPTPRFHLSPTYQDLCPTCERPLWDRLEREFPTLARFTTPQAPLEALARIDSKISISQRWVDFLVSVPAEATDRVIELDGRQHESASRVDDHRDHLISAAGLSVRRFPENDANPPSALWSELETVAKEIPGGPVTNLTRLAHGPGSWARLAAAIALLMRSGHLTPGRHWSLTIECALGLAPDAAGDVLNFLSSVSEVWGLRVMPVSVEVNGADAYRLDKGRFRLVTSGLGSRGECDRARIVLDPFTPPHATLPPRNGSEPTVVIRGSFLPQDLEPLALEPPPQRRVNPESSSGQALNHVVQALFGHSELRPSQREAVLAGLAREDSCVILPTGGGKSLIYWLVGLLQPGATLTVAPLKSLIDDQDRRLREEGIDRVLAWHGDAVKGRTATDVALKRVSRGEDLFLLVTPERLMTRSFRDAIRRNAEQVRVNLAVVDEAHCVSEWGHDFRPAYLKLGENLREHCRGPDGTPPPLLALTATASPAVKRDIARDLEDPVRPWRWLGQTQRRGELSYSVHRYEPDAREIALARVVTRTIPAELGLSPLDLTQKMGPKTASGLVFVPHAKGRLGVEATRRALFRTFDDIHLEELGSPLSAAASDLIGLYSGNAGETPAASQHGRAFLANDLTSLVCTKAFGMGIDKPNIRWTVHQGMPSSIEAFAQESGRAGRDGERAHCALNFFAPTRDLALEMLDSTTTHDERVRRYTEVQKLRRSAARDDLDVQLYFLYNSYPGVDHDLRRVKAVVDVLADQGWPHTLVLPVQLVGERMREGDLDRAIFRLSQLGVLDDYTKDFGADTLELSLPELRADDLDETLTELLSRLSPGNRELLLRIQGDAPSDMRGRVLHHARLLLEAIYDRIESSRLNALREMYLLAEQCTTSEEVSDRIHAYLSEGPLAAALSEIGSAQDLDVAHAIRVLERSLTEDPLDLQGAAARSLEAFPEHPILLVVRGLAESFRPPTPESAQLISQTALQGLRGLGAFGVDGSGAATVVRWVLTKLGALYDARGAWAIPLVMQAWDFAGLSASALETVETELLRGPGQRRLGPEVLRYLLARRLARLDPLARRAMHHLLPPGTSTTRDAALPDAPTGESR